MKVTSEWLTAKAVAERTSLTTARVGQLVASGKLVPIGKFGMQYVFDSRDIERFAEIRRQRGRPRGSKGVAVTIADVAARTKK